MARSLSKRLTITGILQATMPLHVGGLPDNVEEDMPLAKNGRGEFYVPGTSLAGVFRAWMEKHFDYAEKYAHILTNLWGFQEPQGTKNAKGAASRIFVEDAIVTLPPDLSEELWDSVGIDRRWGTSAQRAKFDYTVLPKGSTLDLRLQVDLPPTDEANIMRAMIGHLMKALQAEQIVLGAATTRGLGQVQLTSSQLHEVDWTQKASVLKWLADEIDSKTLDCEALIEADSALLCRSPNVLHLKIDWVPIGPLMTKASYDGIAVDILPRISGIDGGKMTLVLPGSSLKGVLRTQAERIIRTVLNDTQLSSNWLEQVQVPLVDYVFGAAKKKESKDSKMSQTSQKPEPLIPSPGCGCLSVHTCYAKNVKCTVQQWHKIEAAQSSEKSNPLYHALKEVDFRQSPYFEQGFHVAIDRWTGGTAEGFLYSAIEPFQVEWEPIEMTLDLSEDRYPAGFSAPALTLLLLLLRDLSEQRIPIGFGVNRGYGALMVSKVAFHQEGIGETEDKHWLDGLCLEKPFSLNSLPQQDMKKLQNDWQTWINTESQRSMS